MSDWDWKIRAYNKDSNFAMETVHKGIVSRDIELEAIEKLGYTAVVTDLTEEKRR